MGIRRRLAAVGSIQEHVLATYRDRARHYDITANLYYLLGFRVQGLAPPGGAGACAPPR